MKTKYTITRIVLRKTGLGWNSLNPVMIGIYGSEGFKVSLKEIKGLREVLYHTKRHTLFYPLQVERYTYCSEVFRAVKESLEHITERKLKSGKKEKV